MIELALAGVGVLGPGLPDWPTARAALREPRPWTPAPTVLPLPVRLPANERRRAGALIKASIAVADQAVAMAGADPAGLATVFASSTSDPLICHQICEALAQPERLVSPTRFTNSVHNAAAGYWHIATHSMQPSTSVAAFDASFGAALLQAAVQCVHGLEPLLLVAADVPYPEPLHTLRPLADTFAVAFVLAPVAGADADGGPDGDRPADLWRLRLSAPAGAAPTPCTHAGLEPLRRSVPAARALPLLEALAAARETTVVLEAGDDWRVQLEVLRRR